MVWTASLRLFAEALPHAYTMVLVPSLRVTSAGPMATVVLPARTTSADTVPAAVTRDFSFGLVSPVMTAVPPARTSTAGAAAS